MASATAKSKISPVVVDVNGIPATTYVATQSTGPDANGDYKTEVIQYSDAKGGGAKTIGTRDPETGELKFNNNASALTKKYNSEIRKASNNQMSSIEEQLAQNAKDKADFNRAKGKKNQDNTNGNSDSTSAKATPAPRNETGIGFFGTGMYIDEARNQYNSKYLCYPVAMEDNLKDNLQIKVIKHEPKAMKGLTMGDRPKGPTIGSVILPMPTSIQDGNKTEWGSATMTPAQMAASGAVKAALGDSFDAALQQAETSLGQFQTGGGEKAMENFFTEQLTGATDLLSRTEGVVMNPNMELLFKGPGMRSFSFSWKMSPRDRKESIVIAKIIRTFKQSMAPQKVPGALFLKAPNVYDIEFKTGSRPNRFLPKIKTCGLTDCAVNYTPDGSFMAYDNDSMVALELTLSFQEMEPIYNNDMSTGYDSVGY